MTHDTALRESLTYTSWKEWNASDFGTTPRLDVYYFAAEFRRAMGSSPSGLQILEIGFGNGAFLGWARALGNRCAGVDTDRDLLVRAQAAGIPAWPRLDDPELVAQQGNFDAVVAFDVLEHMEESSLVSVLLGIHHLLVPGGIVLARFPNGSSPFGRHCQHGDPTHRTTLSLGKIDWIARISGFSVVISGGACFPIWRGDVRSAIKRAHIKMTRFVTDRVLRFAYFNGTPICLDETMVVVLRKHP